MSAVITRPDSCFCEAGMPVETYRRKVIDGNFEKHLPRTQGLSMFQSMRQKRPANSPALRGLQHSDRQNFALVDSHATEQKPNGCISFDSQETKSPGQHQ